MTAHLDRIWWNWKELHAGNNDSAEEVPWKAREEKEEKSRRKQKQFRKCLQEMQRISDVRFGLTVVYSTGIGMGYLVHQGHIFLLFPTREEAKNQCTDGKETASTEM